MKLLLLGCHLLLITARAEGQLDEWTTPSETDTPAGEEGVEAVEVMEGVSSTPSSDQPTSQSTTPTATADEPTTSSPTTIPEATTSPPDVGGEPTVSPEAESDDVAHEDSGATHADTTSTSATTTTTTASAPASEGPASPTHSVTSTLPNESTGVVVDTSQSGEDISGSTLAIPSSTEGVDFQHSPTTTTTTTSTTPPPPAASTEHATTVLTTSTTTDTPATQTTTTTTTTGASTTLAADITTTTTTTTTTPGDIAASTTSEESTRALVPEINGTSEPAAEPEPPLGVCFGKTEINTLVVVAVVVAVNVVAVVLTALCVHRIVSRRLSWDLLPLYRQRSTRGGDEVRRRNPSGRDLASDTDCKAGEGGGQAGTHIPILITNEDGWCVPYSNETQEGKKRQKKEASATVDTGV